jgi:hypothetical protein
MSGAIPPLPNKPSWRGGSVKAQGYLYLYLFLYKKIHSEKHRLEDQNIKIEIRD